MSSSALPSLAPLASLFDPQRPQTTPDSIRRRRALADALAEQAVRPDAGSMLGAIGKGLQGLSAAVQRDRADQDERSAQGEIAALLARTAQGGAPATLGMSAPGMAPGGMTPASMRPAPTGLTRDPGAGVAGNPMAQQVFEGLRQRGVPSMVAAGMVGNIGAESGFKLDVADGRGEGSVGLIQARGPRLASLKQLAAETGRPTFSLNNQLDHIVSEFNGPEKAAYQKALTAQSPGEAGYLLGKHYERPAAWALQQSAPKRMGIAEDVYRRFGQQADAGPAAQADMPVPDAQPVSFLTDQRDPNGGFFIPPGVRAAAPAGDPSGLMPGEGAGPATSPDVAALLSTQPMGPAQSFVPPGGMPPVDVAGPPAPMADAPMPPARPSAADLQMPAPDPQVAQAPAIPSMVGAQAPAMPAPGPQAMNVPLPPQRPSDAALMAPAPASPNPADLPAPGAVNASGSFGMDPQAAYGQPVRDDIIKQLMGGAQDGMDRIFGGPETQARLDRQAAILAGGQAPQVTPRAQQLARMLDSSAPSAPTGVPAPATSGPSREAMAAALSGGQQPSQEAQRLATALDPTVAQGLPSPVQERGIPSPVAGGGGGAAPAAAPMAGQASGLTDARRADLLAIASHPFASPQIKQFAIDQLNPKLSHVDMGDSIGFTDPGGNLVRSYAKTKAADFGEVGRDAYGQPIMGYRNYSQQSVNVPQVPGVAGAQAPTDMNGRPIPQGVDPKVVREQQSKSYAEGTIPASDANVAELRKEVAQRPEFKNYAQAAPIYRSMVDAAGRNTKASDLNLVYGLGKIMDPGSVVREGEMVMANNTQGMQERFNGMISAIQGGAALTPQTRQALMAEAYGRMQSYETEYGAARSHYTDIAKRMRANPDDVIQNLEPVKPWQAQSAASAPAPAVEALKADPRLKDQFEAKYGKGSAGRILGGQ